MGGNDIFHSGSFASASSPPTYTSGAQKWAKTLPNGAVATTGVVIGTKDDPNTYEYRFYVGANDDKVYCYQVSYSGGTFSVGTDPVWTYTCDGDPVGTPVLAEATENEIQVPCVIVSDAAGRVHCIDASDGSRVWRSSGLTGANETITGPIVADDTVYVGWADTSGHTGKLISLYLTDGTGKWTGSAAGEIVSTPAIGRAAEAEEEPYPPIWYIYTTSKNASLEKWEDTAAYTSAVKLWEYDAPSGSQTCDSWPMLSGSSRIYFSTYDNSSSVGRIYSVDFSGLGRWTDLTNNRVTQAEDYNVPPSQRDLGRLNANMANDEGTNANLFQLTMDAGSGTGKPTATRIHDYRAVTTGDHRAKGYVQVKMSSDSDELTSTPIYQAHHSGSKYLYYISTTGKFYAADPGGTAIISGFPKTLSETILRQDLAMDNDGAIVFVTTDGDIKAYWGV